MPPGARVRLVNVLDRFVIDFCMLACGICVEECPSTPWGQDTAHPDAAPAAEGLRHGIAELA